MSALLSEALIRYGYVVVFASAAFEGDATLVTAAFLAHRGYLHLDVVIVIAAAATAAINQVYFWLGRRHAQRHTDAIRQDRIYGRVLQWVRRYNLLLVLGSRFVFGFRIAIPAACGASGMRHLLFTACDLVGAAVWSVAIGFAGYAIGQLLERFVTDLRAYEVWIAIALLLGLLTLLARARDSPRWASVWFGSR